MSGKCEVVTDAGHSTDGVCSGSQVSDLSQIFVSMLLFSQRILAWVARADHFGKVTTIRSGNLELELLALSGTFDQGTLDLETSADIGLSDLVITLNIFSNYDLHKHTLIRKWRRSILPADP